MFVTLSYTGISSPMGNFLSQQETPDRQEGPVIKGFDQSVFQRSSGGRAGSPDVLLLLCRRSMLD